MHSSKYIIKWIRNGSIPIEKSQEALTLTQANPSAKEWAYFLQRIFLWSGSLGIVTAIGYFIAYNWTFIGRFTTFASLELIFIGFLTLYWKTSSHAVRTRCY